MTDRLNIPYCANSIARALHEALHAGQISRINIDDIRAAVVGYLAAGPHFLSKQDTDHLIEAALRKVVEKVG